MRTHSGQGRARWSGSGLLLLSILAGGLLLPSAAWSLGRISFDQMSVERCPEKSGCEWRLSCGVGSPQESEMIASAPARAKYSVDIKKGLDIQSFPTTVHCTAWEDDGWFGETWEKVASNSVTVPAGGQFTLDLASGEQGAVRVHMSVDSLDIAAAPEAPAPAAGKQPAKTAAAAPALQFSAAFVPEHDGRAVVIGLEWKAFKARTDELAGQGLQIDDIETFESGGKRLWNGIFRNNPYKTSIIVDQEGDKFLDSWKKLTGGRMRLTDLEVYSSGGKLLFAGLFRNLGGNHSFWVGQTRKDFLGKVKELAEVKGLRLVDFEPYRSGASTLYAGAFREDSRATDLWAGLTLDAFNSQWQGLKGKEQQVVDLETYRDGGNRYVDAILRAGERGEVVIGLDQATFIKRWREMSDKGLRLISVEAYRD
jgi:hypothetical protein